MEYRVEELAAAAGVAVDTVRFYQSQRLLPPPARRGRVVWYDESHLDRLRRIRDLKRQRLTLDQIRRVVERPERQPLLTALVEESRGGQLFTRREMAAAAAVPAGWARNAVGASTPQPVPTQSAAASVLRESRDGFMLIRSKESTALRRACR